MTEINVPIPTDHDGYLRRECPTCGGQFKWHQGRSVTKALRSQALLSTIAPSAGQRLILTDAWWTQGQIVYAQESAMPSVLQQLEYETPEITVEDLPAPPPVMVEPNDMQIVASPCHGYEPIKVPDGRVGPFHCLVCGEQFAV
jgi:hypothetical protein